MKCQNLIDFSERKVYATKKRKKIKKQEGIQMKQVQKPKKPIIFIM